MEKKKRKPRHYVNNKDFLEHLIVYREAMLQSQQNGTPKPKISNYVGECITLICNRLARRPNFLYYTYIDEMVLDGIESGIAAVNNFDPSKTQNPFGYFTQIAYNAFVRRILTEKVQQYVKHKNYANRYIVAEVEQGEEQQNSELSNDVISSFEERQAKLKNKKKNKKVINDLEIFMEIVNE